MTGAEVRSIRERRGLTLEQLGRLVGVSRATMSRWELGDPMKARDILAVKSALGIQSKEN